MKLVSIILFFILSSLVVKAQDNSTVKDSLLRSKLSDSTKMKADSVLVLVADSVFTPTITPNGKRIDDMISYAKTFLGTPYRYSGTTPSGFDCSGFINYVMGDFGFSLTRTSYGLAELGQTVSLANLRPGDLMFFKGRNVNSTSVGHVALVVEVNGKDIKMIHASTSRGVVIENFRSSSYLVPRYLKAKRLDYGNK